MASEERPARQRIASGTEWESSIGFSRAVRVDNAVFVSGTTAMKDGTLVRPDDAAAQTRQILATIEWALAQAGAAMTDVVRYRVYVTDITVWPAVGAELANAFGDIRPTATLVEISGLIHPDMLVEIEADALLGSA